MKELTIEQKARAYDEALKKARLFYKDEHVDNEVNSALEVLFPELKESEDEKIRKALIRFHKSTIDIDGIKGEDILAWLEKQGEQKSVVKTQMVYPKFRIGDVISPNVEDGKGDYTIVGFNETLADYLVDGGNIPSCSIGIEFIDANFHIKEHKHVEHTRNEILSELVAEKWHYLINDCKLGSVVNVKLPFNWFDWLCRWFYASGEQSVEQKPADNAEPKFKVGDWVVRGDTIAQILDIQEQYYVGLDINGKDFTSSRFLNDDKIHLWTIQDAKDGDVLCVKYGNDEMPFIFTGKQDDIAYCALNSFGQFVLSMAKWLLNASVLPATKEQRDLLFAKMKKAGYEWDAKKKELKKIGQKPTWGEEDEKKINYLIALLQNSTMHNSVLRMANEGIENWLKSIKDRVQSQPKQEWKQENTDNLTDFENTMMHIGGSFFGDNAGLDPNDTNTIKEQANLLLELIPSKD